MPDALNDDDRALLERIATRVAALRMEVPAILALESCKPISLLAGQAMIFFEPMAQALFHLPDYRRFAALVERREALEALTCMIESAAGAARAKPPVAPADRTRGAR